MIMITIKIDIKQNLDVFVFEGKIWCLMCPCRRVVSYGLGNAPRARRALPDSMATTRAPRCRCVREDDGSCANFCHRCAPAFFVRICRQRACALRPYKWDFFSASNSTVTPQAWWWCERRAAWDQTGRRHAPHWQVNKQNKQTITERDTSFSLQTRVRTQRQKSFEDPPAAHSCLIMRSCF